jgi:hypothetical protein
MSGGFDELDAKMATASPEDRARIEELRLRFEALEGEEGDWRIGFAKSLLVAQAADILRGDADSESSDDSGSE